MHEQENTYELFLNGFDFDEHENLKPSTCLTLTQQVVERHLQKFDMGTDGLLNNGLGWVIVGYTAVFDEPIKTCIPLVARTWHSQKKGPYYRRETVFFDQNGVRRIGVSTFSVMLDMKTRTIARRFALPSSLSNCIDLAVPDAKPIAATTAEYIPIETFAVRNSQVDALGHLNNARYAEFAFDVMTEEQRSKTLRQLELTFHSELRRGDTFTLSVHSEQNRLFFRGDHLNGKKAFDILFHIE